MRSNWRTIDKIKKIAEKRSLYSQAIEMVEEAVEKKPTQMYLLILLGDLYRGGGRYEEAIKTYQRVIEIEPGMNFSMSRNIADIYTKNKEDEKAIATYEKFLTLSQPSPSLTFRIWALKEMFLIYEKMGRAEEKLQEYKEGIAREPKNIELYQMLGEIYEALERWEEGSRLYLKALEIAPQNNEIERGASTLAWQCKRSGAPEAALPLFQKFRELEPTRIQYTIALIEVYTDLGEKERARSLLEEFSQKEPKSPYDLERLAYLYQRQGEYARAEEWYRKAREMSDSPWYRSQYSFKLVRASLAEGNCEEAEELLKGRIRLAPNQPAPYLSLAELYRKEEKYRKAKILYKEILGRTEKDWTMDHIIEDIHEALLEVKKKNILRAIAREYKKKLKRDPKNIDLGNYLVQIYKRIEEVQKEIKPAEEPLSLGEYGYYEFVEEIE